jgi:hypothetical protein
MRDAYLIFDTSKVIATSDAVTDSASNIDFQVTEVSQEGTSLVLKVAQSKDVTALAGNLYVILQESDDDSSYTNLLQLAAVSQAAMGSGKIIHEVPLPLSHKRYLKLTYQVTGAMGTNNAYKAWITSEK